MAFSEVVDGTGLVLDGIGVAVIVLGVVLATVRCVVSLRGQPGSSVYSAYRRQLGRAILLGLEFLVAADIIRTVALEPTLSSIAALGLLVLIRTFLSWSLVVEIERRWPWQAGPRRDA